MRFILKAIVVLSYAGLSTASVASEYECAELQSRWDAAQSAQAAENAFDYNRQMLQAEDDYRFCTRPNQLGDYAMIVRECEEDYNAKVGDIESDYQQFRNETLITNQAYNDYFNYLYSQGIYCNIS